MRLLGFELTVSRAKSQDLVTRWPTAQSGWLGSIRESCSGAWQRGVTVNKASVLTHNTVWACQTLISSDVGKLSVDVIELQPNGVWSPKTNSQYSGLLWQPNHYQHRIKFFESWMLSKLAHGNAYVLKERDGSRKVRKLFILDPSRVSVLVATDGSVYYQLSTDNLAGLTATSVTVPASEIIHDVGIALYHPLCGLSPIVACGLAATQSLKAQEQSARFFENDSQPGGVLTGTGTISNDAAERIQKHWEANFAGQRNVGKVAVLGDGLKYEPMSVKASDAQLVEQLKWSDERICSVFHVPPFMVGVGAMPAFNIVEQLNQQYYSQCLQTHIESIEMCLDRGLELDANTGIQFDLNGLIRMDSATKMEVASAGVQAGIFSINDARKSFNLPPVEGGETPYLQQQNWPIASLAKRPPPDAGLGDGGGTDEERRLEARAKTRIRSMLGVGR